MTASMSKRPDSLAICACITISKSIAQLLAKMRVVFCAARLHRFVRFFNDGWKQRIGCLLPVPRAAAGGTQSRYNGAEFFEFRHLRILARLTPGRRRAVKR